MWVLGEGIPRSHAPLLMTTNFPTQALAVADFSMLASHITWYYSADIVLYWVQYGFQMLVVNTTMILAVCRWVFVCFPLKADSLMTPLRTKTVTGLAVLWVMGLLAAYLALYYGSFVNVDIVQMVVNRVGFSLPLLVLIVFTVSMIQRVRSLHWARLGAERVHRETPAATILLCVVAFLAYCVGQVAADIFTHIAHRDDSQLRLCALVQSVSYLLYVLNSALPFTIYCCSSLKFRTLLAKRVDEARQTMILGWCLRRCPGPALEPSPRVRTSRTPRHSLQHRLSLPGQPLPEPVEYLSSGSSTSETSEQQTIRNSSCPTTLTCERELNKKDRADTNLESEGSPSRASASALTSRQEQSFALDTEQTTLTTTFNKTPLEENNQKAKEDGMVCREQQEEGEVSGSEVDVRVEGAGSPERRKDSDGQAVDTDMEGTEV